jgi:hypothetical protein
MHDRKLLRFNPNYDIIILMNWSTTELNESLFSYCNSNKLYEVDLYIFFELMQRPE